MDRQLEGGVHTELIDRLAGFFTEAVASIVSPGPWALLDFPDYANIGDSLIWLGSVKLLEAHHGMAPAYVASARNCDFSELDSLLPEGTVYIKGGGNFGDLYPRHQIFRERVMRRYGLRVVQLPQSLHFGSHAALEGARGLAQTGAHLMVRDQASLALGQRIGFAPLLVPDAAFGLGPLQRSRDPDHELFVLKRSDKESTVRRAGGYDWSDEPLWSAPVAWLRAWRADHKVSRAKFYQELAAGRLERGVDMLSRGRVVATDRLHAHILALLLGIPHFVADNSTGKISGFIECWTSSSPLVHRVSQLDRITPEEIRAAGKA